MPPNQRAVRKNVFTLSSPVRFRTSAKIRRNAQNRAEYPKNIVKGVLIATCEPSLCCSPNTVKTSITNTNVTIPTQTCSTVHPL